MAVKERWLHAAVRGRRQCSWSVEDAAVEAACRSGCSAWRGLAIAGLGVHVVTCLWGWAALFVAISGIMPVRCHFDSRIRNFQRLFFARFFRISSWIS